MASSWPTDREGKIFGQWAGRLVFRCFQRISARLEMHRSADVIRTAPATEYRKLMPAQMLSRIRVTSFLPCILGSPRRLQELAWRRTSGAWLRHRYGLYPTALFLFFEPHLVMVWGHCAPMPLWVTDCSFTGGAGVRCPATHLGSRVDCGYLSDYP